MNKSVIMSMCILILLAIPAVVMAAPMGEENATIGNESNATMMPENMTGNQTQNMTQNQTQNNTLVDVINQDQNLTILATAINATNLTETLSTGGPYTCFAPDDEAFQALGNDTVNQLLNNTTILRQILLYHVVQGNYTSAQLMNMTQQQNMTQNQTMDQTQNMTQNQTTNQTQNMTGNQTMNQTQNMTQTMTQVQNKAELQTLLGENLTISLNQSTSQLMVNNASIIQPEINASNGIVHVIDKVLIPENVTISTMTSANQTTGNMTTDNQSSSNGATISIDGNVMTWINRMA